MKKKKTSTRKQEPNPVYNECMMFDVPPDLLHRVLFVISVADTKSDSARSDVIGRVVIGSATTGESLRHWHQMLISPRRPEFPIIFWVMFREKETPPDLLHRVLFVISVADTKSDSARSDVIGRVVIGSATTGESLRHWHQMLISPRRPVAAWHRLKL